LTPGYLAGPGLCPATRMPRRAARGIPTDIVVLDACG